MRLAIVTDAWRPQVNGVVTTLEHTSECLERNGIHTDIVHPEGFLTAPCPSYPSIRMAVWPWRGVARRLQQLAPNAIHISTEGPLGLAARAYCKANGLRFTTSYHTQYPRYLRERWPIPEAVSYAFLRRFHSAAARTMVATASVRSELELRGFTNLVQWERGVNADLFRPRAKGSLSFERPISMVVGRLAVEKNLPAFLDLDLPGTKVVVGDGPQAAELAARFPAVRFAGVQRGEALARYMAEADVFVFPSRTDTFGVVMLEAMASGVPVAAYPVAGPIDVVRDGVTGALHENLAEAIRRALLLDPKRCRDYALTKSWSNAANQFASHLISAGVESHYAFGRRHDVLLHSRRWC